MSTRRPTPRATNDLELMREFNQRLNKLEGSRTATIGSWRMVEVDGFPRLIKPNMAARQVGFEDAPQEINFSDRGTYVTPEELAEAVTGDEGGLEEIRKLFENFRLFFENIDFTNPDFDVDEAFQSFVTTVVQPLIKLQGKLKGLIDISWLTDHHQNMVTESGYDSPITIATDDPKITHDATDGFPGSTPLGCMKVEADGAVHERGGELIEVGRGWILDAASAVKWEGLTATSSSNAIRLELQPFYVEGDTATPVGTRVLVGAVLSPSGSSGGTGGWGTGVSGSWTVPNDGSVTHVALFPKVTAAATAGTVKFDNTTLVASQDIPQAFVKDLLSDLQSLLDWLTTWVDSGLDALGIPLLGDLFDRISDLADGLSGIQTDADDALSSIADALDDLGNIFDLNLEHNPILPFAEKVKGLIDRFFGGGPKQVVSQDQVGAASGSTPTDGNNKTPWVYLPEETMGLALKTAWTLVNKTGTNQPLTGATDTLLTGWSQSGPGTVTIVGNKFKVPFNGMWNIEVFGVFSTVGSHKINVKQNDVIIRETPNTLSTDRGILSFMIPASTTDEFGVYAYSSGTPQVLTDYTFVRFTFVGLTTVPSLPPAPDPVTFDAAGDSDWGGLKDLGWWHPFGIDAKTVIVPVAHESPASPIVVKCGTHVVPLLSGPTYVGNVSGANSRISLYGGILPDSVKGTTPWMSVTFGTGAQSAASSANSLSFNNVGSLGAVKQSSGSSSPSMLVPSNVSSMVVCQLVGTGSNFSGFNRTLDNLWNFSAFNTFPHLIGHAQGGSLFTASGGRWVGKAIELVPVSP